MAYEIVKRNISELTLPDHFYHATPIWAAEAILDKGLKLEFGKYNQDGKQYLCIAELASTANGSCDTVHSDKMKQRKEHEIVTFGFNLYLDPKMLDHLGDDLKYPGRLVTFRNFSPKAVDQLIISRAKPDRDYSNLLEKCDRRNPKIEYVLTSTRT